MYKIQLPRGIVEKNSEPWDTSFSYRCNQLRQSISEGLHTIILLYERADTSTFRYRGYNIYQITKESSKYRSIYFFVEEIEMILPYIEDISLVVLIRMRWTHMLEDFIGKVKLKRIPLLFDIDDLVFNTDYLSMVTNTLNVPFRSEVDYDFWFAYISRIEHTASKVDGFITTNHYLGEKLKEKFNKPYGIIPNFLNEEQLLISEECVKKKEKQTSSSQFSIGYFSGTPSHINDFKSIYRELLELLNEFPKIQLRVVGFMEFPLELQPLIKTGRIVLIPLVNFLELQRLISEVDINIVPLVDNAFTNCKSELKFFEAAIVNTPTFAQPTFTYKSSIQDGHNGFLCKQGEWYEKIKLFYLNKFDTKKIVQNARKYALDNYGGGKIIEQIESAYRLFF